MRSFEFSEGTSNKFWNVTLQGNRFTVQFGKIGSAGQTQIKEFADAAAAQKEHDKLVAEKVKKGYRETTPAGASPAPASAPEPAPAAAPAKAAKARKAEPAPVPASPPTPAPAEEAPPAGGLRTFEFSDATSHKFWNAELQGKGFTVTYGRIGAAGQKQVKTFPDEARARKEYDKLVEEKVKKGYRETTPSAAPKPTSQREAFEAALADHPDDLASHMAYADYLTEQGDPLGDFIRVQLALEDPSKSPAERKKLQQQEKKLLDAHFGAWMGDLAPWLKGEKGKAEWDSLVANYSFRRGWLDTLEVNYYRVEFMRRLANAPQTRLLRRLVLVQEAYEEPGSYPPGDDVPEGEERSPHLYCLVRSPYLRNVREFALGEFISADEEMQEVESYFRCSTDGEGVAGIVKQMPRLEELYLFAHRVDTDQIFSLRTLHNLRVLQVYHNHNYPLGRLARNPSLGKLTHLLLHPHAAEDDALDDDEGGGGAGYLRYAAVKALVESSNLPSLAHLRLRCSDIGDKGIRTLIKSGILKRLKTLDLRHGRVTDEGARLLAACPDVKNLESLDLIHNSLTAEGIQALAAAGVKASTQNQWRPTGDEWEDNQYLFSGDPE